MLLALASSRRWHDAAAVALLSLSVFGLLALTPYLLIGGLFVGVAN